MMINGLVYVICKKIMKKNENFCFVKKSPKKGTIGEKNKKKMKKKWKKMKKNENFVIFLQKLL